LREALREVSSRATSVFDREAVRDIKESLARSGGDLHPSVPAVASPESIGRPAVETGLYSAIPTVPAAVAASGAYARTSEAWERMARDQQGFASINAVRAVVEGLGTLPGRKTLVLFAESLALPEAVMPQFDGVVALANRLNVSVYTMDAAGLRVHSKDMETAREVNAISAQSNTVNDDGSTGGLPTVPVAS
jgi:hypothetical protein